MLYVFYNNKKKSVGGEKKDEKAALFLSCNPNPSYLDAAS